MPPSLTRLFPLISAAIVAAVFLPSCSPLEPLPPVKAHRVLYQWHDHGGTGKVKVKIDLNEQKAFVYRGTEEIGWSYVATGKEGHGTPSGNYTITEKIEDKYSNRYGWIEDAAGNVVNGDAKPSTRVPPGCRYVPAPMPYWMRLTSYGIGMHAGLIPEPGQPASHGCIRMPKEFVPDLFDMVVVGTPVQIVH
ncbi:MAG: L,D-transpeptidase family protein [Luteolibacter sp.]